MAAVVIVSPLRASDSYVVSPRTSRRWVIAVVSSRNATAVSGLCANPADGGCRLVMSELVQ